MAESNIGVAYDVGGENKRVIPFTIQHREWLTKFHNIGILFFNTIVTLRQITDHSTDMVVGCFENFAIYSYDSENTNVDDGENYLKPENVDQYSAGRWVLRAKFDGGSIELKFYNTKSVFPTIGNEAYLYIDKSNGRLYRWSDFISDYIGMSVNYSLDCGMLGGQLPSYYKEIIQVNSLPLSDILTTVIYLLLEQDGDKAPYTLWAWDGAQWNGVGGSFTETDPIFQQWLTTASIVESITSTDNHIVVDNTDPKNPSLSFQLVDNENLLTDDELAVVQATSGTNTGDQVGDGITITGAGTIADPFVATNTSLWQQKENELLNQLWLPSTGELQVIHDVLYTNGIDVFYGSTKKYWSSCDVDMLTAYYFDMINNTVGVEDKESDLVCGVIRCNKFTSTEILSLGELTNHGGYVFYIVNNGTDFTYWEAFKTDFYGIWHGTGPWFYTGTTSPAFGEGENNTNEILALDEYHFTLAYLVRSIPTTVDNSQIIEPKNEKLIETADIIDIDKYLKKDTTLQTADTPIGTSLFSFWKIGIGRVKIAWSDLLNTIRHNQLMGLSWLDSGHTGTSNKIAGFGASGEAVEYIRDSFVTSAATSGTITLVENQSLTLTTTLTNSHTLTITPTVPTTFDPPRWEELLFTVGATLPSITWTEPSGVTFEYADKAFSVAFTANKKVMILYKWISSTRCIIRRNEY